MAGRALALGIALWVLVVIPGLIFLRRQPEDMGLVPDGMPRLPETSRASENRPEFQAEAEPSWRRADAVRTSTLWLLVAGAFQGKLGVPKA